MIFINRRNLEQELINIKKEIQILNNRVIKIEKELNSPGLILSQKVIEQIEEHPAVDIVTNEILDVETSQENIFINIIKTCKSKQTLEGNIGKKLMGVLASILIFIGVISFIALIFTSIPEFVKFLFMWVFAGAFLGFGLYKTKRNQNAFYLSISSCGIGLVYISLLISFFYFNYIPNELILFTLMVIWSIYVLSLTKQFKSDIFIYISYIGLFISLLLGTASSYGENLFIFCILMIINSAFSALAISPYFNRTNNISKIFPIFSYIGTFILTIIASMQLNNSIQNFISFGFIFALLTISLVFSSNFFVNFVQKSNTSIKNILMFISNTILLFTFSNWIEYELIKNIKPFFAASPQIYPGDINMFMISVSGLIHLILFNLFEKKSDIKTYVCYGFFILGVLASNMFDFVNSIGFISIISLVFMLVGMQNNNKQYKKISLITFILSSMVQLATYDKEIALFYVLINIVMLIIYHIKIEDVEYQRLFYVSTYACLFSNCILFNDMEHAYVIVYFVLSAYFFIRKYLFEKYKDSIKNIENYALLALLTFGISLIHETDFSLILRFIMIVLAFIQCFLNYKEILNKEDLLTGYYIGIKTTIFVNLILHAFLEGSDVNYIYSLVCLIIAVISIIYGFKKENKTLRIYGLGLSIFSVLKLVLVDITYTNSITRIISFIASGLICFFIVWIYNKETEKTKK